MKSRLAALVLLTIYSVGVSVAHAAEVPFSTNDLSILFPLKADKSLPKFAIHPGDPAWRMLSVANFESVIKNAQANRTFLNDKFRDPQTWYLVAARYTPCTLFKGATPACKEQMRFVYQPFGAETGTKAFSDYAMHVVYNFAEGTQASKNERLEGFRKIKSEFSSATLDRPLQPHPVLSSADGEKYLEALRREVVEKFANTRAPSLITFIGLGFASETSNDQDSDHWIFFQGNIDAKGNWLPAALNVGAPKMTEEMVVDQEQFEIKSNLVLKDNTFNLLKGGSFGTALKILDQSVTNDHNVNCASCHIADRAVFPPMYLSDEVKEKDQFLKSFGATLKNKPRVTELLLENSVHAGKRPIEVAPVRIFGYLYENALISQRAASDSALAVEQANTLLGLKPKPQCASDEMRTKLLTCLYLQGASSTLADCLKSSCR